MFPMHYDWVEDWAGDHQALVGIYYSLPSLSLLQLPPPKKKCFAITARN